MAKSHYCDHKVKDLLRVLVQDASAFRVLCNSVAPPRFLLSLLIAARKDGEC